MANITLKGNAVKTCGNLPAVGTQAPDFKLRASNLSYSTLEDYKGTRVILNIFPSLDTGTCAASVRQFNKIAGELDNTKVLCISRDTPMAQKRFCGAEGLDNVITLSDFNTGDFGKVYGLLIMDGPMEGFLSRSVVVFDETGKVTYTQQVSEISVEPNYDDVLKSL